MMIHIGMTGTRNGMTVPQKQSFAKLLRDLGAMVLHHGDCVGADYDAHLIATNHSIDRHIHPPEKDQLRAFCKGEVIYPEKGYFPRNRDIVDNSAILIGTPATAEKTKNSGTWYTINYGISKGKTVYVVSPDGTYKKHN